MYSGTRKVPVELGDFKDMEVNNKFAMICVEAENDPRGHLFWMAKVIKILTKKDGIPQNIKLLWYRTESEVDTSLDGKYYPEVDTRSKKLIYNEICLQETTVYAYNFALLGNNKIPVKTRRIIERELVQE